jgi:MOSC domain-containing protein
MPTLARINVTPIKGTALRHVPSAHLSAVGLSGNRRFFLVDRRGALYSGLAHGPLVQVVATADGDELACRFPDGTEVRSSATTLGAATETDFYGRPVPGHVVEGPIGEAFADYVGSDVRLIRTDRDGDGADELPLTIVSLASVEELGRRGGNPALDPLRFRINLELDGAQPFEEDTWDGGLVRIGADAILRIAGQIPRCAVTTQDPRTGVHDWNTLKQIAAIRPLMPTRQVPFGMYATVETDGLVRTGDPVVPLGP